MLHELRVENLLLIERAELCLGPGLNVLTGETGAGKTVLAHALDLLLGGKPRSGIVRPGAAEAYVEGVFALPDELRALLEERLAEDADELVLARRVSAEGRTRAYLGGRSATAADLQQAAREGDCLIVALNSDESVRSLNKAPDRPIFQQEQRAIMLAALEAIDYVVIFNESTPHAVLERLRPDLLVKGGTYNADEIVGRELVESYGGQVKALGAIPGISTTRLLEQLRSEKPPARPVVRMERKAG